MSKLPPGWAWTTVGEIAETSLGKMLDAKQATGKHITPYLRNINVRWGHFDLDDVASMDIRPEELDRVLARPGEVIACEGGEPGRAAVWRGPEPIALQKALHRIRPSEAIVADYLALLLQHHAESGWLASLFTGTTIKHLPQQKLRLVVVPLPPLAEQERIVTAVEEAFSKLDAGDAGLRTVRQLLRRMREAVLTAAVTGRLALGDEMDPDSPASGWLTWSSAKPDPFEGAALADLPPRWVWARAASACEAVECGGTPSADRMSSGTGDVPFIKVYNLTLVGRLDFSVNPTFIDRRTHERQARSRALPGDVLTNIVGPPLGKVAVVPANYPEWNMNQAVVLFRPRSGLRSRFLALALQSQLVLGRLAQTARATAGQFNVSLTACRYLPVPVPPEPEQDRIITEVERQFSFIEECGRAVDAGLARSAALRRSVLKAAFEGKLAAQDPTDEPASVMLERVRVARAATDEKRERRRGRMKVETS